MNCIGLNDYLKAVKKWENTCEVCKHNINIGRKVPKGCDRCARLKKSKENTAKLYKELDKQEAELIETEAGKDMPFDGEDEKNIIPVDQIVKAIQPARRILKRCCKIAGYKVGYWEVKDPLWCKALAAIRDAHRYLREISEQVREQARIGPIEQEEPIPD